MAISGLNKQEAITLLQRQGLSTAQQAQVLSSAGLLQTTQMLNASLVEEAVLNSKISGEKAEQILTELGLIESKTGNLIVTKECTVAEVAQALATKGIVGADTEAILSQLGLATANTTTTVSFAGLTTAIKANTVAMAKWLVTNPVGWCILAVGAIYGLSKAYDALTVSEEEMVEAHEESVQKAKDSISEYEELKQELETIQQTYDDNEQKLKDLYKLRENQTITQAEQDYLEELEGQNEKLRQQIEYKQTLADIEAKEAEDDAVTTLNEKTQDDLLSGHYTNGGATVEFDKITDAEKIKQNTATINALTADLTAYEKVIRGIGLSQEEVDKYTQQLVGYQEQLNSIEGDSDSANAQRSFYQGKIDEIQGLLNGTLTYEEYEKAVSEATGSVQSLVTENDTLLQKVEPLNDAIKSTSGENYELKKANDEIIANAKDAAIAFNGYTDSLNGTADALGTVGEKDNKITVLSITDSIKQIADQLEPQFAKLGEAYRDIFTEDGFTLDNIDNSMLEDLRDTFTDIEEELGVTFDTTQLNNFFDVLTNGSSEPEDVQKAFNDLATSYLNSTDVLESLNEETAESVIKQLEQMGVTNAETIVMDRLNAKKEAEDLITNKLNITKDEFIKLSADEQQALLDEADASEICRTYLAQLTLAENNFNKNNLDVTGKIESLKALAVAYGLVNTEAKALEMQERQKKMEEYEKRTGANTGFKYTEVDYKHLEDSARKEIEAKFENLGKVNYDGNKTSYASKDKSSSSKEAEKTAEEIDWIEKLLERIQSRIDKLDKTASSTYRAWSTRNKALLDELKEVNGEIKAQQKAYDVYMAKANSVGLSEHYKQLVQNGGYSIEDITDDTLKEQISEYEEWYNKAMDCSDAIDDLKNNILELTTTQFENVFNEYEDSLSGYRHQIEMLETYIDQTEAKGYVVSGNYYKQLIETEKLNIKMLQDEYAKLKDSLQLSVDTGKIVAYSDAWYEMVDSIRGVQKSIEDANTSLINYQTTLRELEWESFDRFIDKISKIKDESDFLVELMSDKDMFNEDGITDEGQATLGLHAINYNVYLSKVEEYAKKLKDINEEIANDPNNQTLLERRQELLELQQESILSAKEEQQSILDLKKEGYDIFLDTLQELIDKQKELLDSQKSLHDYEKSISKKTNNISNIKKQLEAYKGDTSESAKATIQKLEVSLREAEEDLEETEYDKYISDQQDMLDELYDNAEEWANERLDNVEQLISDVINSTNENASDINDTIKESADDVGYTISSKLSNALTSASNGVADLVSDYNDNFLETMTTLQSTVDDIRSLIAGESNSDNLQNGDKYNSDEKEYSSPQDRWTKDENNNWNYYENGEQVKDAWTKYEKDDKWYHLGDSGVMDTNTWIKNKSGTWSYVDGTGAAVTGWHKLDWQGKQDWYNFDDEGNMLENQWIDDYFVAKSGKMLTNTWIGHNGKYYWVGEDGKWLDKEGWSLDYKPNDGLPIYEYAKGSKRIPEDQLALVGEKGQEIQLDSSEGVLKVVGKGDMVFTNEASRKLWEFSQDPEGYMSKIGTPNLASNFSMNIPSVSDIKFPEIKRTAPNQNVSIGDINLYGVNDPQEFAQQVKGIINNALARDNKTRSIVRESVLAEPLGRTDRSYFYR